MRNSKIDVSVVVAARDEATYINEALTSILLQNGISLELIYVDDNSKDQSIALVFELAEKYPQLKVLKNPSRGKCSAFNYGVSMATGRFVCIFAGDDVMPPGSLQARYAAVCNEPDDICVVGLSKLITMSTIKKFDGHVIPKIPGKGNMSGVSPMMNKMAVSVIFPTPEHLPNEDTWMELAIRHMPGWRVIHSNIICCRWRFHSGNSINMTAPFNEYSKKISIRMDAMGLFLQKYGSVIDQNQREILQNKIVMEQARRNGDWFGVLLANCRFVDRLRALSTSNSIMYSVRRKFYGLLGGW